MALADALDWEAARLADVASGRAGSAALLWQCERALAVPAAMRSRPGFDAACARAAGAGWPVHLRATGGDVVPQGPGVLNLTLVFMQPKTDGHMLDAAYLRLTAPIVAALAALGQAASHAPVDGAFCDGRFNVAIGGRKFAGTAQRWRPMPGGHAVQAHALMLLDGPDAGAVDALNTFYADCGIDRRIAAGAHVALADLRAGAAEDFVRCLSRQLA